MSTIAHYETVAIEPPRGGEQKLYGIDDSPKRDLDPSFRCLNRILNVSIIVLFPALVSPKKAIISLSHGMSLTHLCISSLTCEI